MELFELPEFNENGIKWVRNPKIMLPWFSFTSLRVSERRLEALEEQLRVSEQVLTSNHLF